MKKKIFNYLRWKSAQAAPPAPPMPPPMPPAAGPGSPGSKPSGDIRGIDKTKSNTALSDDAMHVDNLDKLFQSLLVTHDGDIDLSLALACQEDGRGVVPASVDVAMTGKGAPFIRGIRGLDLGPQGAMSPPVPPPMI